MDHSIFAIELCARLVPESSLRAALAGVIASAPDRMTLHQKWMQYQRASQIMVDHLHTIERGCWDYFNDDQKARDDYAMWTKGMLTMEGVRPGPSGLASPYRTEPRYLTFTMALLLVQDSPTDRMIRQLCEIPQAYLWHRETFGRILRGMASVSFASVASDVMYLIPRDDDWALTPQDLDATKFEYLRPVVG